MKKSLVTLVSTFAMPVEVSRKECMKSEAAVMTAPVPDTLYTPARMWCMIASMSVSALFAMVVAVRKPCSPTPVMIEKMRNFDWVNKNNERNERRWR